MSLPDSFLFFSRCTDQEVDQGNVRRHRCHVNLYNRKGMYLHDNSTHRGKAGKQEVEQDLAIRS
jgi:hypothetical protein